MNELKKAIYPFVTVNERISIAAHNAMMEKVRKMARKLILKYYSKQTLEVNTVIYGVFQIMANSSAIDQPVLVNLISQLFREEFRKNRSINPHLSHQMISKISTQNSKKRFIEVIKQQYLLYQKQNEVIEISSDEECTEDVKKEGEKLRSIEFKNISVSTVSRSDFFGYYTVIDVEIQSKKSEENKMDEELSAKCKLFDDSSKEDIHSNQMIDENHENLIEEEKIENDSKNSQQFQHEKRTLYQSQKYEEIPKRLLFQNENDKSPPKTKTIDNSKEFFIKLRSRGSNIKVEKQFQTIMEEPLKPIRYEPDPLSDSSRFGHFLYGDKLQKILQVYRLEQTSDYCVAEVMWKVRKNNFRPENSILDTNIVKDHSPKELMTYYEYKLKSSNPFVEKKQ